MIPAVRRAFPLLLLVGLPELAAQGPTPSPAQSEANRLYQARDWPAAARAYDALVALAPASQAQGPLGGLVFFGMARAQARLGEKDRAFEALKKARAAGFAQVSLLESEPDLLALRADARFKEVIAEADRNARPCVYRPESRAFDFWVGDWDVTTSAGPAGNSHVERILGDCVIFESFDGAYKRVGKVKAPPDGAPTAPRASP
ncbi:MAG: hypothetical protein DMF79_05510 [Acidobacteria bacterium]|nr:MAG: hypothetical protein DMF79_05510 [Acidobacteriota bacterium]